MPNLTVCMLPSGLFRNAVVSSIETLRQAPDQSPQWQDALIWSRDASDILNFPHNAQPQSPRLGWLDVV
jgi:hypothetical protein